MAYRPQDDFRTYQSVLESFNQSLNQSPPLPSTKKFVYDTIIVVILMLGIVYTYLYTYGAINCLVEGGQMSHTCGKFHIKSHTHNYV